MVFAVIPEGIGVPSSPFLLRPLGVRTGRLAAFPMFISDLQGVVYFTPNVPHTGAPVQVSGVLVGLPGVGPTHGLKDPKPIVDFILKHSK